jgi:hypothetical protein
MKCLSTSILLTSFLLVLISPARSEVLIDIDETVMLQASGETTLDGLSVNDTALLYTRFCISDGKLYIPGWTKPADLAASTHTPSGVMLKVTVMPGKEIRAVFVDAAQAQSIAKGNASSPPVLSPQKFNEEVISDLSRIFRGGDIVGTMTCQKLQENNPLRKLQLFEVNSINGFNSLSALLKSVAK